MALSIFLIEVAFGLVGLVLCLIALIVAPLVVDKVDKQLAPLAQKGDALAKGYLFSVGRMGWYGFVLMFRRTHLIQHWFLRGKRDRLHAIDTAPSWMVKLMIWVHLGFIVCAAVSLALGGGLMFLDRQWQIFN